jgi:hypothetical protein
MESVSCAVRTGPLNKKDYVSFWNGLKLAGLSRSPFLIYTACIEKTRGFRHGCVLLLGFFFDSLRYSIVSSECCFVSQCRITEQCINFLNESPKSGMTSDCARAARLPLLCGAMELESSESMQSCVQLNPLIADVHASTVRIGMYTSYFGLSSMRNIFTFRYTCLMLMWKNFSTMCYRLSGSCRYYSLLRCAALQSAIEVLFLIFISQIIGICPETFRNRGDRYSK